MKWPVEIVHLCDFCQQQEFMKIAQSKRKYCSERCRKLGALRDRKNNKVENPPRACLICEEQFIPKQQNSDYCSKRCRAIARQNSYHATMHFLYPSCYEYGRFIILNRDGFTCIYCGRTPLETHVKLHVDHILPKIKGGTDTIDNLVTACQQCNQEKSSNLLHEPEIILAEVQRRNLACDLVGNTTVKRVGENAYQDIEATVAAGGNSPEVLRKQLEALTVAISILSINRGD